MGWGGGGGRGNIETHHTQLDAGHGEKGEGGGSINAGHAEKGGGAGGGGGGSGWRGRGVVAILKLIRTK